MDLTGEIVHDTTENTSRAHDMTADCWCKPTRERFDFLIRKWTRWDAEGWVWEIMDPQPEPPDLVVTDAEVAYELAVTHDVALSPPPPTPDHPGTAQGNPLEGYNPDWVTRNREDEGIAADFEAHREG